MAQNFIRKFQFFYVISANMKSDFKLDRRVYYGNFSRNGEARTSLLFGYYEDYILVTIDWIRVGKNASFTIDKCGIAFQ